MRATSAGGNQVDIALAHRLTVFGECHRPRSALAFGKAVVVVVGIAFAFKQGNDGVATEGLHQVIAQATFVKPALCVFGFFIHQGHAHTGHQHRFAAQQMHQFIHRQGRRFKIFRIRPHTHGGALLAVVCALLAFGEFFNHIATGKHQGGHLAFAVGSGFHALGQRIGHAHTHAVQTA